MLQSALSISLTQLDVGLQAWGGVKQCADLPNLSFLPYTEFCRKS